MKKMKKQKAKSRSDIFKDPEDNTDNIISPEQFEVEYGSTELLKILLSSVCKVLVAKKVCKEEDLIKAYEEMVEDWV